MLTAMKAQTLKKYVWKAQWVIVISMTILATCTVFSDKQEWTTYQYDGEIVFTLEYPATWTTTNQEHHIVLFTPPDDGDARIENIVYDPVETPPLPVHITYDTLRVFDSHFGPIPIMKRDPAAVTEQYAAMARINSHIAEFRLHAKGDYDEIFDHMLVTARPITSREGDQNE